MKKLAIIFLVFFLISFLFYENRNQPKVLNKNLDFISLTKPPKEIEIIFKNSCYDCHSLETKYPTYSKFFPISFLINHHISEAREHFDFSDWENYNKESKNFIIQNSIKQIENNKMPMASYRLLHPEANLNKNQKEVLITWLKLQKY